MSLLKKFCLSFSLTITLTIAAFAQSFNTPVQIQSTPNVGQYISLKNIGGNPALSFYDVTNQDLKYVRATGATGSAWGTSVTIDGTGNVGQYTSLQTISGNPAIAYYDVTNFDLKYVRANDATGASWGTPVTIDNVGTVGQYTSLQIVNGNPAISYFDATNGDLKYVRATNTAGTTWGTPVSIDAGPATVVGRFNSMQIVAGIPAISYYDGTNGDLKFVRANDVSGASWGTPVAIDATGTVGQYTSLQIIAGNPAISYYDLTNGRLKYIRALNIVGSAWNPALLLDVPGGDVGAYTSLQIVSGNPAISYVDNLNVTLKYIRAVDASGGSWGPPVLLAGGGGTLAGDFASMIGTTSGPGIAYYNVSQLLPYFISATGFTLPVTLTNVKAYQLNSGVQIEWLAEQEINIESYNVERSADGIQFNSIGIIAARANGAPAINYSLFDAKPINGLNYYRIRITDRNGMVKYGVVMKVMISKTGKKFITVYPNPATGNTIGLQINNLPKGVYTIVLYNKAGQIIATQKLNHIGGSAAELVTIPTAAAPGVYQLGLSGNGIKVSEEVIKK